MLGLNKLILLKKKHKEEHLDWKLSNLATMCFNSEINVSNFLRLASKIQKSNQKIQKIKIKKL